MERALLKFNRILSAQDIMTPVQMLERADRLEDAIPLFEEYDVVPYPKIGGIEGFFRHKTDELIDLRMEFLISDGTSLLDMPRLLDKMPFYFIIAGNKVTGYVHYSDLNKPVMKIPLFVLFQILEKKLWDRIKGDISKDLVRKAYPENAKRYLNKHEKARKKNVDIGWTGVFSLPEILKLARHLQAINMGEEDIEVLRLTRNDVAHSDHNLISRESDVSRVATAVKLCQSNFEVK
jgi:hypothetical protein